MNVVVIGGVAAGTKAAAKLLRLDRGAKITIYTKGKDISYVGCGLPYYVGGDIESREELIVNTPEKYTALTGAQVRTGMEAVYTLCDVDRGVPEVWGSVFDVRDLLMASVKLRDGKPITDMKLGLVERFALKEALKKVRGTDIEKVLKEFEAI